MRKLPRIKRRKTLEEQYARPIRAKISALLMHSLLGAMGGATLSVIALILFTLTETAQAYNPQDFILFLIGGAIGGLAYPLTKLIV